MSNPVAQRILSDANAKAAEAAKATAAEAQSIEEEAGRRAKAETAAITERAEERARQKAEGIVADARLSARLAELETRQSLITKVVDEALSAFQNLPVERYREVALRQIKDNHFPGEQDLVVSSADQAVWDGSFVSRINAELASKATLKLTSDGKLESRTFLLRQGRKSVECGARSALRSRRDKIEETVVKTLFGEQSS